jgi:hypothetical protein
MRSEIQHQKDDNIMTEDRLRRHLFSKPKAKFWGFDEANLTIGLEVEYFIAKISGSKFRLATKDDYIQVTSILKERFNYIDQNLLDQPGRLSKDTESGFIAIKPDFAWHILEISFPPRQNLDQLRDIITTVFTEVDTALSELHLERLDLSCLPNTPNDIDFVALDRLRDISTTFRPKSLTNPTQDPNFPAYIAATHIHLNAGSEDILKHMPQLFALDPLISKKFTRANEFNGRFYENARTRMYRDTLGDDYLLHTYPKDPAYDLASLVKLMNNSPKLFPSDPFFPVRDMSYIRITRFGTLEFRSCCSFKSVNTLLKIAECRIAQLLAATAIDTHRLVTLLGDDYQEKPA